MARSPVLFIVGPTASGKTAAALGIAGDAPVEIINADSRQIYRGMSIGTAKPTPAQLAAAPHHLIDIAEPDERFSLVDFLARARESILDATSRGAMPVVVGGTGQYVWGLAEGWQVPAVPPDPMVRQELEDVAREQGAEALHERLRAIDPDAAEDITPANIRRVIRAIEVSRATGAPFSAQRVKHVPDFSPRMFGLHVDRRTLHERIAARVDAMLEAGWVEEIRGLLAAGYAPELPSFSSAGYRELAAYVDGSLTLDEAVERARSATRRLARMQSNWFKANDARIAWHTDTASLVRQALEVVAHRC